MLLKPTVVSITVSIVQVRYLLGEETTAAIDDEVGIVGPAQPSHELSIEDFDEINRVNYKGCWLSSRAEITQMLRQEPLPTLVDSVECGYVRSTHLV